jgi:hypothetical protein
MQAALGVLHQLLLSGGSFPALAVVVSEPKESYGGAQFLVLCLPIGTISQVRFTRVEFIHMLVAIMGFSVCRR